MSSYSDFANAASDILLKKGSALAGAKERSGELIGSTIANLGQVIPQQVQQAIQQNAQKRKAAQIQKIIQDNGGDLQKSLPLINGIDPELGAHFAKELGEAQKTQYELAKLKHEFETQQVNTLMNRLGSATSQSSWASALYGAHQAGVDVSGFPLEYSPEAVQQVNMSLASAKDRLDRTAPKEPKYEKVETLNEQGQPVTRFVNPAAQESYPVPPKAESFQKVETLDDNGKPVTQFVQPSAGGQYPVPPPSMTPYQAEELKLAKSRLSIEQQRLLKESQGTNEPLVAVMKDGKPVLVRRSQAVGMTPASAEKDQTFNQAQTTAAGYAKRVEHAEQTLSDPDIEKAITNMGLLKFTAESHFPAKAQSAEFQKYDQASRNFINAQLRRESGAAISQSEFDNAKRQYLPQPGDTAETLKLKKQNRQDALEALAKGAGGAYTPDQPAMGGKKIGRFVVEVQP